MNLPRAEQGICPVCGGGPERAAAMNAGETMQHGSGVDEYVQALVSSKRMRHQVVCHREFEGTPAEFADAEKPVPDHIRNILDALNIKALYAHQQQAVEKIRSGSSLVVSTPTASGKTLIYNLPVIEHILSDRNSRALYLFPLKALAQDQLRTFEEMAAACTGVKPEAAIYDGDTTQWQRKKIRENLPNVIMTNPEMLHLAFLPYYKNWENFFSGTKIVVVDEVHTYRGVMGSHMAQVFRRLRRVCRACGSDPVFVFSSATISNPAELCSSLTGLPVEEESRNSAPKGRQHLLFLDPDSSPANSAIMLLKAALHRNLRTIVYTQSRKMAELISVWAGSQKGRFAGKISAYRAGYLPGQRREIEQKLLNGELLAVISTSALELGIDIGDLDLCLLVGYPGTIMSTWQRGGRVGRSGHESAIVMIAGEDALDHYIMRHPSAFFDKSPESAVINPYNRDILKKHLVCGASEMPLAADDPWLREPGVMKAADELERTGSLLRSADGEFYHCSAKSPHRFVDLRGSGRQFTIISEKTGENLGEIDAFRAFRETHPGAVYLHMGESYRIEKLDAGSGTIVAAPARPSYYTRVRGDKQTEILETYDKKEVFGTRIFYGRLKVTDHVTGYEKWHLYSKKRMNVISLDLPPQVFETDGIWFLIPPSVQREIESRQLHFMGGIHAVEHAAIGICPLLVLTDRNDLAGISIPFHPQAGCAAVFVYDGIPGGIGLTRQAYARADEMIEHTYQVISSCGCEAGCPSCVHSPKCGSGNRPIDKQASLEILEKIMNRQPDRTRTDCSGSDRSRISSGAEGKKKQDKIRYGVLDLETQRSAEEAGGWHMAHKMGISCVVVYDSETGQYHDYYEADVSSLLDHLGQMELIIGFNIKRFDYRVISGYADCGYLHAKTLDMLEKVYDRLGYRLSLNHLARMSLGIEKSADGLQALKWWKQGRLDEIVEYCRVDVDITRRIYLYGRENGYLLFENKSGHAVRVPVDW